MLGHNHPAIVIPQNTEYAKEMRRWEAQHSAFGAPGRPYEYQEFPKMLFKAKQGDGIAERVIVNDAHEQRNLQSRGFHETQEQALAAVRQDQLEHGKLAAERNYEIQHGRLSERAAAEVRAAEAEHGATHLPEITETPIRKRGRPAKVVETV